MQNFMLYLHEMWGAFVLLPVALRFLYAELEWVSFICVGIMILSMPVQVSVVVGYCVDIGLVN